MTSLRDKVVLITGASSGIGAGTAVYLATLGCRLALHGRNVDNLNKVAEQCREHLPADKVYTVQGDLSKEEDTVHVVEQAVKHYGQLDVLVYSAGILSSGPIETTTLQDYDKMMNINCRVCFHLTQLAIPHLKKTKGTIVNVSSVTGIRAFPNVSSYCMSKAAVDQLTRCAALELAKDGVRVNAVNPGVVVTEVHKRSGMSDEKYEQFLEHSKSTHALGRVGRVDEVAKAIAFLASDDSSYITGTVLPIDGGRHAMCPR